MSTNASTQAQLLSQDEIIGLIKSAGQSGAQQNQRLSRHPLSGSQPSNKLGSGTDFAETRPYQPGDDPRHIDWRATARHGAPLSRIYHIEAFDPYCVMLDRGPSMRFGSRKRLKATQALRVALFHAAQAIHQGRELAFLILDQQSHWFAAKRGMPALQVLTNQGNQAAPPLPQNADITPWQQALGLLKKRLNQGGELLMVSDFLGLTDDHRALLSRLGKQCDTKAVQIIDPLESHWPTETKATLHWGSSSTAITPANAATMRSLQQQQQRNLEALLQTTGVRHHTLLSHTESVHDEQGSR